MMYSKYIFNYTLLPVASILIESEAIDAQLHTYHLLDWVFLRHLWIYTATAIFIYWGASTLQQATTGETSSLPSTYCTISLHPPPPSPGDWKGYECP
ncbi:hypothetical protein AFLA_012868 [Aspergillus flavus NRRL3357]|nr:hypothetical protein AFLA_012868 [Aspergillus flavus NRRL3357]